jgi:hypothetical protein
LSTSEGVEVAFTVEDILEEFVEASRMGRGPRDDVDLCFLMRQRTLIRHRKNKALWIAHPVNHLRSIKYMRAYNASPEVKERERKRWLERKRK